jgi:hypothetical protein
MIADQQLAAEVGERVLEVNRLLNETASLVQSRGTNEEAAAFRLAIGRVLGELLFDVVNPLYQQHPELKQPGLFVPGT